MDEIGKNTGNVNLLQDPVSQPPVNEYQQILKPVRSARVHLTEELEREGLLAMKKLGLYVDSVGNAAVMDSIKEPPSMFLLFLITSGLGLIAYIISEISNYNTIRNNWATYRCMPSITPFAKFYGYSLSETMNFCMAQAVREHAPGVINPIYKGINEVAGVVDGVYSKVESIEGGVAGLLKGFESFVINFVNSFRLLGTRVRMSFIRIKEIFGRVYGLFIAFAYAAISAITFGENLVCNPLVVFLATISGVDGICCFAPNTLIAMADGSQRPIASVKIGDTLADGGHITTTFLFDGNTTKMVRIAGVHVSGNHYVFDGGWIQAEEHAAAIDAPSLSHLWCLSTTTNQIPVVSDNGILVCADYEESSDPAVIAEAQSIAEMHLNGSAGATVPDYSLGLDPTLHVFMKNNTWKQLMNVAIGDELVGGAIVAGLVREVCPVQCQTPGGHYVSAAQLVFHGGSWVRAAHLWPTVNRDTILCHIMVSNNMAFTVGGDGEMFNVRDYAEVTSMDIQAPYAAKLKGGVGVPT